MVAGSLHRYPKNLDPTLKKYPFLPVDALGWRQVQRYSWGLDGHQQVVGTRWGPADAKGQVEVQLGHHRPVRRRVILRRGKLNQIDDSLETQLAVRPLLSVPAEKCVFQIGRCVAAGQREFPPFQVMDGKS